MIGSLELALCDTQGQLFELSGERGVASEAFCLAAYDKGLGTVIMGIFDEDKIVDLLEIPEDRELVALIPVGYPAEEPVAPKRKPVSDLLSYK